MSEAEPAATPPATPDAPALPPIPALGTTPVRAILLDADGVLQLIGTPWRKALAASGGEEFAEDLLAEEGPALSGREDLRSLLTRLHDRLRLTPSVDQLLALWWRATPDPVARAVVGELRDAGYLTVLATNQQWERREWMRRRLKYDGLCTIDAYSCVLGVAKPEPAYFERILATTGLAPEQALFVDDSAVNVEAAAALGIATIHHPSDAGGAVLREEIVAALSA